MAQSLIFSVYFGSYLISRVPEDLWRRQTHSEGACPFLGDRSTPCSFHQLLLSFFAHKFIRPPPLSFLLNVGRVSYRAHAMVLAFVQDISDFRCARGPMEIFVTPEGGPRGVGVGGGYAYWMYVSSIYGGLMCHL